MFSGFVLSCRMRLCKLKSHKLAVGLTSVFVLAILILGPLAYRESWLDPFSTLNIPDRQLRPHAITKLGILDSDNPFHPYYYTNVGEIHELMGDLQRSAPLSPTDPAVNSLENQKILYLTLHREPSHYHTEEDFALKYYPDKNIIIWGQQAFRVNNAAIYALTQITSHMTPGWWK